MKKIVYFLISIMVFSTLTGCTAKENVVKTHTDIIMKDTIIEDTFFGYQYIVEQKNGDGTSSLNKKFMWQGNTKFVFIEEGKEAYAVVTEDNDISKCSAIIYIQQSRIKT